MIQLMLCKKNTSKNNNYKNLIIFLREYYDINLFLYNCMLKKGTDNSFYW